MFTGIIEAVGEIKRSPQSGGIMLLTVDLGHLADGTNPGDSIAVNGACLTVSKLERTCADFDVSGETLSKTTLSTLKTGAKVNLERAMSAQGRFGGHIVQGHVDGIAKIASLSRRGQFAEFRFEVERNLLTQIVLKGSVAADGISLTVSAVDESGFNVSLIPATLRHTTWQTAKVGDLVNIETDIVVKIIQKKLAAVLPTASGLTIEKLQEHGF